MMPVVRPWNVSVNLPSYIPQNQYLHFISTPRLLPNTTPSNPQIIDEASVTNFVTFFVEMPAKLSRLPPEKGEGETDGQAFGG